ncbi:MAG: hypothetical protein GY790_03920 [Bacteroidetes bacterium]|nr:hypothetical protein [Bacteroidota bacterium]
MTTKQIVGEKYIINGLPADVSGYHPDMSADIYYEVVRIIGGKFLFLDDHLERLSRSIDGTGLNFPGEPAILENLKALLSENNFTEGNIRICLRKSSRTKPDLFCFFTPWFYPNDCTYLSGVQLISYSHERPNPGIKKWDERFRTDVHKTIREHGVYEAILLNERDEVTEGSRSNVFFVDQANRLVTPPFENILPGITRNYVLQICRDQGIEVNERAVTRNELNDFAACFITGTSPKVLPVWQIDQYQFRVDHPILKSIMEQFDSILNENLKTID